VLNIAEFGFEFGSHASQLGEHRRQEGCSRSLSDKVRLDLGGEPAAERIADQVDPVEPRFFDEVEIEEREVRQRADSGRVVGTAEARMLRHQEFIALGERIEERQPLRHAAGAVQEQHLGTASGAVQPDADAADFEFGEFSRHVAPSPLQGPLNALSRPAHPETTG
jgi:hypothetical protein